VDTASHSISPEQLSALLGSADAPLVLDVRREERFRESQRLLPGARRCAPEQVGGFAAANSPAQDVVYCVHGLEVGEQAAAQLRAAGWHARYLLGGIEGLIERGIPTIRKRPDLGDIGSRLLTADDALHEWCRSGQGEAHSWRVPAAAQ
jgi:rhodanese-related sulfurtransferase